jgi:hypothetical protein
MRSVYVTTRNLISLNLGYVSIGLVDAEVMVGRTRGCLSVVYQYVLCCLLCIYICLCGMLLRFHCDVVALALVSCLMNHNNCHVS